MKQQRKVIPFQPSDTMTVTLKALPCSEEELERRLLVVYRLFGYTGGKVREQARVEGTENTNDTLIRTTESGGGRTA